MENILISIERPEKVEVFLRIAKKLNFIHSVEVLKNSTLKNDTVNEPVEKYNWISPTRPATDEDIDRLIEEMEADENMDVFVSSKDARNQSLSSLNR